LGLYSQLNNWSAFKEQEFILFPWSDDLSSTFGNAAGVWGQKVNVNSGTGGALNVFRQFYIAIANANQVINYTQDLALNDTYKSKARAEAKFIRGLCYFIWFSIMEQYLLQPKSMMLMRTLAHLGVR